MKVTLDKGAYMPIKAHSTDAGFDLRTPIDITVPGNFSTDFGDNIIGNAIIDTGVHIQLPKGTVGFLKSKSGLNVNHGITSEGVIDEGYRGSIVVKLYNHTSRYYRFKAGDKITQLVILPYISVDAELADELEDTDRGNNGFGSSGK